MLKMRVRQSLSRGHCILLAICVMTVIVILKFSWVTFVDNRIHIPGYDKMDLNNYPDLGIFQAEEFPADGPSRVNKIIHQTWKTTDIPHHYVEWIKTWVKNHPDWTYMFWTDESARNFIADKYPHILPAYDGYLENIRRADAMRYAILYEYGGIYIDLDMESLMPVDGIARKYSCVLPQEPYEHPIIDGNFEHLVINALMLCKAKHPLMKRFLDNIPRFAHMWNVLDSTGPHYITLLYRQYVDDTELEPSHEDGVYLAPAEYFFPTIDPAKFSYMKTRCENTFETLSYIQQRACVALQSRGLKREPYPFSFTDHHWVHTYLSNRLAIEGPSNIHDIVPHAVIYSSNNKRRGY